MEEFIQQLKELRTLKVARLTKEILGGNDIAADRLIKEIESINESIVKATTNQFKAN